MKKIFYYILFAVITFTAFPQKMVVQKTDGSNLFIDLNAISLINFIIPCPGTPTVDYEGKTYNTVLIGEQCWLKENLDVGVMIQGTSNQTDNSTIEKYCYENNPSNCDTYGGLYQWNEAMQYATGSRGICSEGWHIPTASDFQVLKSTVNNNGNILKEIGQGSGSGAGTNTCGFSALLTGNRAMSSGDFSGLNLYTLFWGSTSTSGNGDFMRLYSDVSTIETGYYNVSHGFSIRCIKD